jgi:hypothetical protein
MLQLDVNRKLSKLLLRPPLELFATLYTGISWLLFVLFSAPVLVCLV